MMTLNERIADDRAQIAAILESVPPVPLGHRRVSEWWGWEDVPLLAVQAEEDSGIVTTLHIAIPQEKSA